MIIVRPAMIVESIKAMVCSKSLILILKLRHNHDFTCGAYLDGNIS